VRQEGTGEKGNICNKKKEHIARERDEGYRSEIDAEATGACRQQKYEGIRRAVEEGDL
jgi:hypothetical protein